MHQLNKTQTDILQNLLTNKRGFFRKAKSFYIYGKTGCGKTTILEKFVMESQSKKILFMHFHDYLLDITKLLYKNPLKTVAKEIAKNIDFLCFDEFFVESIADAKILYDILLELIKAGVSIILTSNFAPEELYKDGFNRQIMFPLFSDFLKTRMEICHIKNSPDFRTTSDFTQFQICFPTVLEFENHFKISVSLQNEVLQIDENHTAQISGKFENGCVVNYNSFFNTYTSVKDFRKIARTFTHVHVQNMQQFSHTNEDEAIRFRNFIDILYARGTIFSCSGVESIHFFSEEMLKNIKFKRCESRLIEMETVQYIFAKNKEVKRKMTISSASFFDAISKKLAK